MSFRISICCCNHLFAEGIQQLIERDACDTDYRIRISDPEEEITETDLLIVDFYTFSRMSVGTLFKRKVEVLLLLTGCLPKIQDQRLFEYISKGLIGILLPKTNASQLKKAIQCAVSGELWFTHKKLKDVVTCMKNGLMKLDTPLTVKETEIVKSICNGYSNKEITKQLKISEQSVKKYLGNIYKKVGVTDRLQLALYAMKYWPFCFR